MMMTIKTMKKVIAVVGFAALILTSALSWAGDMVFMEYPIRELKVLETNQEAQTALVESPDGDTATLTVGDIIGQEEATIVEIQKRGIVLKEPPDELGIINTGYVPVRPGTAAAGQ
jgi:hypothetical protein